MTLGEKIKNARIELGLTQSQLADGRITRNMLSAIESDKAMPSFQTLRFLSERLRVPQGYLLSDDIDLFIYRKNQIIAEVRSLLKSGQYQSCIDKIESLNGYDDELSYILSQCYFELGSRYFRGGSYKSAQKHFLSALRYAQNTVYDTERIEDICPLFLSICDNVNSPLLNFDAMDYAKKINKYIEYDFYKYLTLDQDFAFTHEPYQKHIKAKQLIKERKYKEALNILLEIEQTKNNYDYDAYLIFGVYSDIDLCYRQLFDFENAYRYSTKRISLLEGFNA